MCWFVFGDFEGWGSGVAEAVANSGDGVDTPMMRTVYINTPYLELEGFVEVCHQFCLHRHHRTR